MKRVACYIDGFNLYHAIDDLHKPHLKWVNLWSLSESFCRDDETLVKVAYFSAFATWMPDRYARHRAYVAALQLCNVECHMARFSEKSARCRSCSDTWIRREEKETDVHFALTFLEDAIDDVFDRALIVSADSDYIPSIRAVKRRLPHVEVFSVAPPGRYKHARGVREACGGGIAIGTTRINDALLPVTLVSADGLTSVNRPGGYTPPA